MRWQSEFPENVNNPAKHQQSGKPSIFKKTGDLKNEAPPPNNDSNNDNNEPEENLENAGDQPIDG